MLSLYRVLCRATPRQGTRFFLVSLCLALWPGCATTPSPAPADINRLPAVSTNALRTGDALSISLQGVPDASDHKVQVSDTGTISLPYLGTVKAEGLTAAELAVEVRRLYLEKRIYRTVEVSIASTERFVFVGGEVNRPGRILWTPDLTVTKAIQAAGGFTVYARENRISVVRNQEAFPFDVTLAEKTPSADALLAPGDALQVPKSAF